MRTIKGAIILASALLFAPSLNAQTCGVPLTFTAQEGFGSRNKIIIGGAGNNDASISWNCYPDSFTFGMYRAFNFNTGSVPPAGSSIPTWCSRIFHDPTTGVFRIQNGDASCYDTVEWFGGLSMLPLGNVGIGTDQTFGYKLAVNGGIACKEDMLITLTGLAWPDYVFDATYQLKPLSVLEEEIDSLGHLPEMPSAEEVQQNGLSVPTVTATVVKKVEELTLYAIDQQKQLDELKKQNELLQKQNEELKKMLEALLKEKE